MAIQGMNHFTVLAQDLPETIAFYDELLGIAPGPRPAFDFPGAWLYCDGSPVLHIIAGRDLPQERAGVLDHMAFSASGLAATVAKLERRGLEYVLRRQVGGGPWQLFFHDPNGAKIELDFDPSEPAPAQR